jgi:hypothetical protein
VYYARTEAGKNDSFSKMKRWLVTLKSNSTSPFTMWGNPYRIKKKQKKSIFIYGTTFKKN